MKYIILALLVSASAHLSRRRFELLKFRKCLCVSFPANGRDGAFNFFYVSRFVKKMRVRMCVFFSVNLLNGTAEEKNRSCNINRNGEKFTSVTGKRERFPP